MTDIDNPYDLAAQAILPAVRHAIKTVVATMPMDPMPGARRRQLVGIAPIAIGRTLINCHLSVRDRFSLIGDIAYDAVIYGVLGVVPSRATLERDWQAGATDAAYGVAQAWCRAVAHVVVERHGEAATLDDALAAIRAGDTLLPAGDDARDLCANKFEIFGVPVAIGRVTLERVQAMLAPDEAVPPALVPLLRDVLRRAVRRRARIRNAEQSRF